MKKALRSIQTIVTGHYGTGKTEFSVNLALGLAAAGRRTIMADLDIVNPYFRSRECRGNLERVGIRLIASSQKCSDADVPALLPDVLSIFEDRTICGVMDIGGDPAGARVLAQFQPKITEEDYQLIFVSNANRPEVRTAQKALEYLRGIEAVTGLTCGGMINNTHLCGETTPAEVLRGAELAKELSALTGIPVLAHMAERAITEELNSLRELVFPITIQMKKPWERVASRPNMKGEQRI